MHAWSASSSTDFGSPCRRGVAGRGADDHLHRDQLLGDDLAVFQAAVAEGDVDAVGGQVGGALVQQQFDADAGIARAELRHQRRDHLAAEAVRRADPQLPARRPFAQVAHVFQRLQDAFDARDGSSRRTVRLRR